MKRLENIFQKTFPKSIKRLIKIKACALSRINIRKGIQNQKKLFDNQSQVFDSAVYVIKYKHLNRYNLNHQIIKKMDR